MSDSDDESNETYESITVTNPFADESLFGAPLTESAMLDLAKTTDRLTENLTEDINRLGIDARETSRMVDAFGNINQEKLFESISEMESMLGDATETLAEFPVEPITPPPSALVEPASPTSPKQKKVELSAEEAEQVLEESGAMVRCDDCGHPYLQVNAHRMLTNEGGERLCGRCRDASRGVQ